VWGGGGGVGGGGGGGGVGSKVRGTKLSCPRFLFSIASQGETNPGLESKDSLPSRRPISRTDPEEISPRTGTAGPEETNQKDSTNGNQHGRTQGGPIGGRSEWRFQKGESFTQEASKPNRDGGMLLGTQLSPTGRATSHEEGINGSHRQRWNNVRGGSRAILS